MVAKLRVLPSYGVVIVQLVALAFSAVPASANTGAALEPSGIRQAVLVSQQAAQPAGEVPNWINSPHTIFMPMVSKTKPGGPINLKVNTASIAPFEKFEAEFDVQTSASNPDLPYDPHPPSGLASGLGVNVDVLFSSDNWKNTITQPAFYYQAYNKQVMDGNDHLSPAGGPHWMVRFTPQWAGGWQYRVRVQDKDGTRYFPDQGAAGYTFTVSGQSSNPYLRRGLLKVSPTDSRYFQFSDGEPFVGVGFNDSFTKSNMDAVEQKMRTYEQNKMNFMRVWLSGASINGSQWSSWASNFLSSGDYLPPVDFDTHTTYNGHDVSMRLDDSNPCFYTDFWQGMISVDPNSHYIIQARVKLSGVNGDGFLFKYGNWLDKSCSQPGVGTPLSTPVRGDTDWITVNGGFDTSSNDHWLDKLYLVKQNSGGVVYIDSVRVYKESDPAQVNILHEPYANSHMYFDPISAAQWDSYIQSAEQHGVYLKMVVDEKNEWIRNHIGSDGRMTDSASNDNFYAKPGTKVRWLEQAWWRYLIARWGYSPAIHSFEYVNEGDPYNGSHYEATEAMAKYFHQNDPSRHMVTTSFWSSFPAAEFWSNPAYADVDYADLHAYIATGWGLTPNMLPSSQLETNSAYIRSGNASARISAANSFHEDISPRSLVIQGAGTWTVQYYMMAQGYSASCPNQRVRWYIDGGRYYGGKEGVAPAPADGNDNGCTSPSGTFGWTLFSSSTDRSGNPAPEQSRLVINDNKPHQLILALENGGGSGGTAWIDDLVVLDPSGKVANVLGEFDNTAMDADTAWYNYAYGEVFGGQSPVGPHKPLVRGETGIDFVGNQDWNRDLPKDSQGIWLHNNVWGQVNHGGMYDMFWWASETIPSSIYSNYLTFRNFMEGIPLNNGHYVDSGAWTSDGRLRIWGQRDDTNGRMHFWLQNALHTWKNVVTGASIPNIGGSISIPNVRSGNYRVQWWDTYKTSNPIIRTDTVSSNGGTLTINIPGTLNTDLGIKIDRIQ